MPTSVGTIKLKRINLISLYELLLRSLRMKEAEAMALFEQKQVRQAWREMWYQCQEPSYKAKAIERYQALLNKAHDRQDDGAKKKEELLDEQAVRTAQIFIDRIGEQVGEEDVIPGYSGFGPEAGRVLLPPGTQVGQEKHPVAKGDAGTVRGKG